MQIWVYPNYEFSQNQSSRYALIPRSLKSSIMSLIWKIFSLFLGKQFFFFFFFLEKSFERIEFEGGRVHLGKHVGYVWVGWRSWLGWRSSHINCKNGIMWLVMSCLTMHGFTTESYGYCYSSREKPEDKKEESWLLCGALSLDFFTNCANYKGGDDRQKLIFISKQKKNTQNTKKLGELFSLQTCILSLYISLSFLVRKMRKTVLIS